MHDTQHVNKKKITLYPNPADNVLNLLTGGLSVKYTLNMYNAFGQKVRNTNIFLYNERKSTELNLTEFPQGIYIVELKSNTENFTEKLIISKQGANR